jgi:hypothetical protein
MEIDSEHRVDLSGNLKRLGLREVLNKDVGNLLLLNKFPYNMYLFYLLIQIRS